MEAAKEAINKLTHKHGHHTTEVSEHYKPAVVHEQVNPTREHETTTVVDKEIHQDHHHTSVLPIQDKQVLPTEHSHNIAAAQHSEHHHGDHSGIREKVAAEAAQFKDHTQVAPTEKTTSVAPTVGSEHHHHHVHETIQPVIQKQTIQPSVVHTTVPVHETHHSEPKHYTASSLPAVSMDEFKAQGGSLTGIADRTERFEGEPQNIAKHGLHGSSGTHSSTTGTSTSHGLSGTTGTGSTGVGSTGLSDTSRTTNTGSTGLTGSTSTGLNNSSHTGSSALGSGHTGSSTLGSGHTGSGHIGSSTLGSGNDLSRSQQAIDSRVDKPHSGVGTTGSGLTGHSTTGTSNTTSHSAGGTKPSLIDKLNPFKDTDGDGKKGVMN